MCSEPGDSKHLSAEHESAGHAKIVVSLAREVPVAQVATALLLQSQLLLCRFVVECCIHRKTMALRHAAHRLHRHFA